MIIKWFPVLLKFMISSWIFWGYWLRAMVKRGRSKVAKLVNVTNRGEEKCKIIISSPCKRKLQPDQEMITKTNKNKSEAKTTSKNRDTKKNVSQNRSLENLFNWTVETLFTEAKMNLLLEDKVRFSWKIVLDNMQSLFHVFIDSLHPTKA